MIGYDIPVGSEFAGHRINGVLGRGGMSVVYEAEHLKLGQPRALKVLAPSLAADDAFRERFARESRLAAALDHPNIVSVYDAGEAEGRLYIAMRLVDGPDLRGMIEQQGNLSLPETLFIVEQVASALDAAHEQGLVHRDVKPANVLVARVGMRAFLTDFGIVKQAAAHRLTETGIFIGTFEYAAPEQFGKGPVDGRADLYALACVIHTCLTGDAPYQGDTEALIRAHLVEPPPKLTARRPDLPAALDGVLATALAKAPEDRYQSCGAFAAAFRSAALGRTTGSTPPFATVKARTPAGQTVAAGTAGRDGSRHPTRTRWHTFAGGRSRLIAVAAALTLAGVGTALALTRGDGETGSPESGGHKTGTGQDAMAAGEFPDAVENELVLAHVPEPMRETCSQGTPPDDATFLRSVVCRDPENQQLVRYSRAHSGEALREYFLERAGKVGVSFPTADQCRAVSHASGEWTRSGRVGHVEGAARRAQGRVLCYTGGDRFFLEWTDTSTKLFASATSPAEDRDTLYAWWEQKAGPGQELAHERHPPGEFPDAIEEELLLAHLPEALREQCRRAKNPDASVFLRSITCPQKAGGDPTAQYSYAHNSAALRAYFSVTRLTALGLDFPTQSFCREEPEAAGPWRREGTKKIETRGRTAVGSMFCVTQGGRAILEWTDVPRVIYAVAERNEAARTDFYDWWMHESGPVVQMEQKSSSGHG